MSVRVRDQCWKVADAANVADYSARTIRKWLARFDAETVAVIETLRRLRMPGPQIAEKPEIPLSAGNAALKRIGRYALSKLETPEPPDRYCGRHPGELIHIDIKELGSFSKPRHRVVGRGPGNCDHQVGWEAVHMCIDDTSRVT